MAKHLRSLFRKYLDDSLSAEEAAALFDAVQKGELDSDAIPEDLYARDPLYNSDTEIDKRLVYESLRQRLNGHRVPSRLLWWWAAAASVLLLVSVGAYFLANRQQPQPPVAQKTDVLPGGNKAVLTLADGSTITLDSTGNQVIQQGATAVKQQGGQLLYDAGEDEFTISYNTLTTPRGGQFRIQLPDGTLVWLNAASAITYPTAFTGKERKVEVTGEAYFEVTKDPQKPFLVDVAGQSEIEVLGTHFNVNAYHDESSIKTVLLEGAISVKKGTEKTMLRPGQQAQTGNEAAIRVTEVADVETVVAWKNGRFSFNGADLEQVMRQLSRWYDVEIRYTGPVKKRLFVGNISRSYKLQEVLAILEASDVHFRIEDREIVVTQ
ncbi:FecR family protein [Chitinophaga sp. GCM10012297]|uniref:FecR domain-containing protein n=1 Tax=Chitinophaga chungangae TaxID=2821488 RepID=A0ABS3YCT5_9BACT|nr:FecR domain-containing protein [Chitinophaga chungangae]MBO9152275.1 FecR domain-containing protein [Chitinophaga chungangae]